MARIFFQIFFSSLVSVLICGSGSAQELPCDQDQLGKACIDCLMEVSADEQVAICYQSELKPPMAAGLGGVCPSNEAGYNDVKESIVSSIRALTVENQVYGDAVLAFQRSQGDCTLLQTEQLRDILGRGGASSEIRLESTIISELNTCLAKDIARLFDLTEDFGQGTEITGPRIIALQNIQIELTDLNNKMRSELARSESLRSQGQKYVAFCGG